MLSHPLRVGTLLFPSRVFLAPLSGVSDLPFRRAVRRFGVGIAYSEMIASGELLKGSEESLRRAMADGRGLHAVQLAGRDPAAMQAAAAMLADSGADLIDINFGCPAKRVTGGLCGSALMREPDLALRLVEATIAGAGRVPVSVKMRLGWNRSSMNAGDLAVSVQGAGACLVTVHGRTRQDFYDGHADWAAIASVKARLVSPVIANGDLVNGDTAAAMLRASQADAVMIGRGTYGRPWFPALLSGQVSLESLACISLADVAINHYAEMLEHYGPAKGLRHARKHLGWYLGRFEAAVGSDLSADREALLTEIDSAAISLRLRQIFGSIAVSEIEIGVWPRHRNAA